jgi:hypothetical protein
LTLTPPALVVVHPFGKYVKGDLITETVRIAAILGGGNANFVIAAAVPPSANITP